MGQDSILQFALVKGPAVLGKGLENYVRRPHIYFVNEEFSVLNILFFKFFLFIFYPEGMYFQTAW